MTSLSWCSGKSAPSMKFMTVLWRCYRLNGCGSVRAVAGDPGPLHQAVAGRVVHDRVVLRGAVVPHRHVVLPPAPADLVLGDLRLIHEVLEQLRAAGRVVLAVAHVLRCVEVREVRG